MGLVLRNGAPARANSQTTVLREALTSVSRALEDVNWTNLSIDPREGRAEQYTMADRRALMARSRLYVRQNPLAKQASTLLVNYVLGQGISLTAANKTLIARIVDEFWESPVNRETFTGHQSMAEFLQGAFADGAQYLVLFPDTDAGTVELGAIDPMFVDDVLHDPDNWRIPKWYRVRRPRSNFDFKAGTYESSGDDEIVYYRHWRNSDPLGGKDTPSKVEEGLVYPCRRGKGKFGTSDLQAAVDWLKAHKDFMEDRATISRAAAAIAWKKKRKNSGANDIAAEVARMQSSLRGAISGAGYDSNPPPVAGSTVVENESSTLEWVKTDTGGPAALADERILRMMVGSGMGGIPNHYFGDEANANLATATAMELPLLKMYEGWQKWLADIVSDLITFTLETAHEAGRIGERDDSTKYSSRSVTASNVLDASGAVPAPISEAGDVHVHVAAPQPTVPGEMPTGGLNNPGDPGSIPKGEVPAGPGGPTGGSGPRLMSPFPIIPHPLPFQVLDEKVPGPDDPVDWYVDIDFPPILQKDTTSYFAALKSLYEMLPIQNPESAKLVISMALNGLGINDVDQVIDRLFPILPVGSQPGVLSQGTGMSQGLPQAGIAGLLGPGPQVPTQQLRESMSPLRIHRILSAVREVNDALPRTG